MTNYDFRDAFRDAYWDCKIPEPAEYKLGNIKNKNSTIYSVDEICKKQSISGSQCDDFIIFDANNKTTGLYLIERKGGENTNAAKAYKQLQGGANFIEGFSTKKSVPLNNFCYFPVLVSKKASRAVFSKLRKTKITLNNQSESIQHIFEGDLLPEN